MTEEISPDAGGDVAGSGGLDGLDMSRLAEELVESARGHGVQLTGNEGLLTALTQKVLQSALEAEMADHLGRDRYERAGDQGGRGSSDMDRPGRAVNVRNGSYPKTLRTEVGEVTV